MDAGTLTLATIEPALIAVVAALATGGPGLVFAAYKWRKTAPQERESVVVEASERAVSLMRDAIDTAAAERRSLVDQVAVAHRRIGELEARVAQLEGGWPPGYPLPARP